MTKNQTLIPYLRPASKRTILVVVAAFVDDHKFLTNWSDIEHFGWHLPAIADPHYWCGMWRTIGCLNAKMHTLLGKGNRIYLKQFQRSCYRARCKTCYLKWIARQANNGKERIETYSQKNNGKKSIHLMFMPPPSQHYVPVKILRQRLSHILKLGKIEGGALVFHPFRFDDHVRRWYWAPHFHFIGFGNEQDIQNSFGRYGWYVKNKGERESVFQTFCYVLSHCGINKKYKAVTWFGELSYSSLQVDKEPRITCCPVCGGDFIEIYYEEGFHPVVPPDKTYEGLVDAEGWYPVKTIPTEEIMSQRFDYAPNRHLMRLSKDLQCVNHAIANFSSYLLISAWHIL